MSQYVSVCLTDSSEVWQPKQMEYIKQRGSRVKLTVRCMCFQTTSACCFIDDHSINIHTQKTRVLTLFYRRPVYKLGIFQIFCEMDIVTRCLHFIWSLGAKRELFRYQESPPAGKQLSTCVLHGQQSMNRRYTFLWIPKVALPFISVYEMS